MSPILSFSLFLKELFVLPVTFLLQIFFRDKSQGGGIHAIPESRRFRTIGKDMADMRVAVLASQLRFNVAQIVVQSLEAQGFFLEQANYEKDDYRETFVARTCNYAGNEVVVSIDPDPGLDEGGKINIQSLDAGKITEHELHQRNFEIFNAILENGIEVGEIKEGKPDGLRIPQKISHLNIPGTVEKKISEEKYNHGRY